MREEFNVQEFIRELRAAFKDVPPPPDDKIIKETTYWECLEMENEFRGKHWENVSGKLAFWYRMSLICFTPEAFHFFLPAFLIAEYLDPNATDISGFLIDRLVPPRENNQMEKFLATVNLFSPAQREVVKKYVDDSLRPHSIDNDETKEFIQKARAFWKLE